MIKKIWKDPVGSKVISWLIIGVLTLIALKIKSHYDDKSFRETLDWLINYQTKLIYIVLGIITYITIRFIFKRKKNFYSKKQRQLREFNHMTDSNQGVRNEWTTYFGSNGKPFITDLEFYCTGHGDAPLRFYGSNCSVNGCKNSRLNVSEHRVKNHIESLVINEWNKIK